MKNQGKRRKSTTQKQQPPQNKWDTMRNASPRDVFKTQHDWCNELSAAESSPPILSLQSKWYKRPEAAESSEQRPTLSLQPEALEQSTTPSTSTAPSTSTPPHPSNPTKTKKVALCSKSGKKPVPFEFFKHTPPRTKSSVSIEQKTEESSQSLTSSQG